MRPAQLRVIPGTFSNCSTLARLISTRAAEGSALGAFESNGAVPNEGQQRIPVTSATCMVRSTAPFCAWFPEFAIGTGEMHEYRNMAPILFNGTKTAVRT